MDLTRIATLLLGAWIGGCVFMDVVATQNFRSVDRLLAAPPAPIAERIRTMGGHNAAQLFLRYQASELNRHYFPAWENTQIVLGALLIFTLVAAGYRDRPAIWLPSLMLAVTLLMHFLLTPEISRLGRAADLAVLGQASATSTRFWIFHGIYSALELIKLGWGVALAIWLVLPGRTPPLKEAGAGAADPAKLS